MLSNAEIGLRIEDRRKELGLTLDDIANEIGVARSTIQRYEKGKIEKVKLPVIEAIANVLEVNPAWLVGKSKDKNILSPTKAEKDVEKILDQAREQLMGAGTLMFDGEPATQEDIEAILSAMEVGVALAKKKAREKFTPKKYRE